MKYRNLFFDLDDTIWAFSRNARDTFEEVYRKYSFERYFDSFDHYYTLYQPSRSKKRFLYFISSYAYIGNKKANVLIS